MAYFAIYFSKFRATQTYCSIDTISSKREGEDVMWVPKNCNNYSLRFGTTIMPARFPDIEARKVGDMSALRESQL